MVQTLTKSKARVNYGEYIGRKQNDPRYIYQKNSLKVKRNIIPLLDQKYSTSYFPTDVPNQMAHEWSTLLSKVHSTTTKQNKKRIIWITRSTRTISPKSVKQIIKV